MTTSGGAIEVTTPNVRSPHRFNFPSVPAPEGSSTSGGAKLRPTPQKCRASSEPPDRQSPDRYWTDAEMSVETAALAAQVANAYVSPT